MYNLNPCELEVFCTQFSENVTSSMYTILSPRVLWGLSDLSVKRARNLSFLWIFTKSPNTTSRIWKLLRGEEKMKKTKNPFHGKEMSFGHHLEEAARTTGKYSYSSSTWYSCCMLSAALRNSTIMTLILLTSALRIERGNSMLWLLKELLVVSVIVHRVQLTLWSQGIKYPRFDPGVLNNALGNWHRTQKITLLDWRSDSSVFLRYWGWRWGALKTDYRSSSMLRRGTTTGLQPRVGFR